MMMILHEKFISMKIVSLYKYASLQKQTETTIKNMKLTKAEKNVTI